MASFKSLILLAVLLQLASQALAASVLAGKSAAAGPEDLIGGLIDHLTCTRTTNRGFKGRCVPKACCSYSFGVDELCMDRQYTCCYGGDRCTGNGVIGNGQDVIIDNEFDEFNRDQDRYPTTFDRRCGRNHVRRQEWDAEPTRERIRRMSRRVEHVIVHHTGDGDRVCWSFDECRRYLRYTQRHYQNRKQFPDIPWNFLISENGEVFEGMGWGVEGYHTSDMNDRSLGIAFIGDFDEQTPTRRAMQAFSNLLECGVSQGYLDSYYGIYGHRDLRNTDCPGDYLYDTIRQMKAFRQYGGKKIFDMIGRSDTNSTNTLSH